MPWDNIKATLDQFWKRQPTVPVFVPLGGNESVWFSPGGGGHCHRKNVKWGAKFDIHVSNSGI
jgi:hypothetical protein